MQTPCKKALHKPPPAPIAERLAPCGLGLAWFGGSSHESTRPHAHLFRQHLPLVGGNNQPAGATDSSRRCQRKRGFSPVSVPCFLLLESRPGTAVAGNSRMARPPHRAIQPGAVPSIFERCVAASKDTRQGTNCRQGAILDQAGNAGAMAFCAQPEGKPPARTSLIVVLLAQTPGLRFGARLD